VTAVWILVGGCLLVGLGTLVLALLDIAKVDEEERNHD
jgi:hypothetical protein